jgi:hypothetical protein
MSSAYAAFDVKTQDLDGTEAPVPLETVKVYDVTHDVALDDLETDANGHIDAGTLDVAAGTVIRFSFLMLNGRCGYSELVTT